MVKGPGVMKEYYRNPEATDAAFHNGWLLTGDIVREDEDGFLWIVDRKKDVIITGGENIYPVEIEDFLQSYAKIQDVAVIGLPDQRLGRDFGGDCQSKTRADASTRLKSCPSARSSRATSAPARSSSATYPATPPEKSKNLD